MALQLPNKGAPPTGIGGDTFDTAALKLFDNTTELYTFLGYAPETGLLPNSIPITKGGTGATTLEGAMGNLGVSSRRIAAYTDLNSVVAEGYHHIVSDGDAATLLNCPLPSSFSLRVSIAAGVTQHITFYRGALVQEYKRAFYWGNWSEWDRIISDRHTATKLSLVQLDTNTDEAFISAMTSGDKSGFFFDGGAGKATFAQYSVGMFSSLQEGGFFGIGADVISGRIKTMSGVKRPEGNISFFSSKELLSVGAYGLGSLLSSKGAIDKNSTGINPDFQSGFYEAVDIIGSMVALNSPYGTLLIGGSTYNGTAPQYAYYNSSSGNKDLTASSVHTFRTTQNTWVDGNGFIKAASPVVELYANEIKLNNEAKDQDIIFEKVDAGSYLLKGTTGLAQDGWYIEQPKDSNGNIFHAVEYGTHDNGDIWIKTYEQIMEGTRIVADHTKPVDIKENRFITIRLNELPKDTTAPINPAIKDNEGNAAPSRLHELVDGMWVISDENAAILEQERLAAMPSLKRRQFRLTLAMNGYDLAEIESLINQIEDPMQRTIAQIEWQDATDFERTNSTLLMMTQLLGLSSEDVNSLWEYGLAL